MRGGPYYEAHSADHNTYIYREGDGAQWEVWIRGMLWGRFPSRNKARTVIRALKKIPNDSETMKHWAVHEQSYKDWKKKP